MNKKTDKLIDALGKLDEEQIASCMNVRRRGAFMQSGKARVALVLAAALLITTLASALIVLPMMLDNDNPGENPGIIPGITTGNNDTAPNTDATTNPPVQPPENQAKYPGIAQLLSLGTISYSGIPVSENGAIREPENPNVVFDSTKDYFSAPLPVISFDLDEDTTVKLSCDYGSIGRVVRATEYGEEIYEYVDANGKHYNLFYLMHFAEHEVTIKGNQSVSWNPEYQNGFINAGLNRDSFIDYEVYSADGEIIAAGCIYVAAFRYTETLNLKRMTKLSYRHALSNFSIHEHLAEPYTLRKAVHLYGETFADENGVIDAGKREAFYAYHDVVKATRSALPEAEWIDTSLFADEEGDKSTGSGRDFVSEFYPREEDYTYRYDSSIADINMGDGYANPYDNYGEVGVGQTLEQILQTLDEQQMEYYRNFLERKAEARAEAEKTFTAHEQALIGFAKLSNDKIGLDHHKGGFTGGVSIGCNSLQTEQIVFVVQAYKENGDVGGWWMVIGDSYSAVVSEDKTFPEEGKYHYVETYVLKDGREVIFAFLRTPEQGLGVDVIVNNP